MGSSDDIVHGVSNATLAKAYNSPFAVIDSFLASIDVMVSTRMTYRKSIEIFFGWIPSTRKSLGFILPADIITYKDYLLNENRSSLIVNLYLSVVRKFCKWAKLNGLYPNITGSVTSERTNKKTFRKMHIENEEVAVLYEEVTRPKEVSGKGCTITKKLNEKVIAKRDFVMVNLILWTSLRMIEVSREDIGDIVKKRGRKILKVWVKGHSEKDDFVVLADDAFKPIIDYLKFHPGIESAEPLFICDGLDNKGCMVSIRRIQKICKDALRAIGLYGHEYSALSLRHTTSTQILLNGGTKFNMQNILRHSTPVTSQLDVNTIMEGKRIDESAERIQDKSFKRK